MAIDMRRRVILAIDSLAGRRSQPSSKLSKQLKRKVFGVAAQMDRAYDCLPQRANHGDEVRAVCGRCLSIRMASAHRRAGAQGGGSW